MERTHKVKVLRMDGRTDRLITIGRPGFGGALIIWSYNIHQKKNQYEMFYFLF